MPSKDPGNISKADTDKSGPLMSFNKISRSWASWLRSWSSDDDPITFVGRSTSKTVHDCISDSRRSSAATGKDARFFYFAEGSVHEVQQPFSLSGDHIMTRKPANCGSQNGKAKSKVVTQIARIVRMAGLDYSGWR